MIHLMSFVSIKDCTHVEMSGGHQRPLEEMRRMLEKSNPFEIFEDRHDVFGHLFELTAGSHVALLRTSKKMNEAVRGAGKRVAIRYAVDTGKFNSSTDSRKAETMLNDLRSAIEMHNVQDIRMCDLQQNGMLANVRAGMLTPLASILETCAGLTSLTLTNNQGIDVVAVAAGLAHLTGLTRLNLSRNVSMVLGTADWELTALTELNLWGNYLFDNSIYKLTACIHSSTALTDLNLGRNGLDHPDSIENLTTFLTRCPGFARLNLSGNDLQSATIGRLAAGLPALVSLVHLDLRGNNMMSSGLNALGEVLPMCTSLQSLDVGENSISPPIPAETYVFTTALPLCPRLKKLDLSVNDLGVHLISALVRVLRHCDALESLRLFESGFVDESARLLAMHLPVCNALTELDLRRNELTAPERARLKKSWVYQQNRTADLLLF